MSFLDKTGLTRFWSKCKAHFAPIDHSHELTDEQKEDIRDGLSAFQKKLKYHLGLGSGVSSFTLPDENYRDGVDIVNIHLNGIYLHEGLDYTISGRTVTLTNAVANTSTAEISITRSVIVDINDYSILKGDKGDSGDVSNISKLSTVDSRNTNEAPSWYMSNMSKSFYTEFKSATAIGLSSQVGAVYVFLITTTPWHDNSGGRPVQIAFHDSFGMFMRGAASDSAWGSWQKIYSANTNRNMSTNWTATQDSSGNLVFTYG